MKYSLKTALILSAFAAFATTSCTERQQENTEAAADQAGNAAENTADEVEADMAREPGDTAVVQNKTTDGLVEETPATPQN